MNMKKLQIVIGLIALLFTSSCIKNELPVFDSQTVVEFDAASWNANAAGLLYPVLTRVPGYGRAVLSSDPALTRTSTGIKKFRVNLVGQQNPNPVKVFYTVFAGTTAVENEHYKTLKGELTIPANSSYGEVEVEILNPGPPASGTPSFRDLNLILTGGDNGVTSSVNYRVISLRIAQ
jgi:hypothetical protein